MKRLHGPAPTGAGRGWFILAGLAAGLLLATATAHEAYAQDAQDRQPFELVGTVQDAGGRPLVGAFVAQGDSKWGSLTSETGRFVLPNVTPGPASLTVELIGYETRTWTGIVAPGEALKITLEAQPILLEGLNVVTDRFESRRRATATTVRAYDRRALVTSPQDNALDFLTARAGITRTQCRGEWSVVGGMEYLSVIPPHELYLVEVYASGRHIRAYTNHFMERAAKTRLRPMAFVF